MLAAMCDMLQELTLCLNDRLEVVSLVIHLFCQLMLVGLVRVQQLITVNGSVMHDITYREVNVDLV